MYNDITVKRERFPYIELDPDLIQAYATTFIRRFDMYPMQLASGRYTCVKKRLDLVLIPLHLQGAPTLGAYALDEVSQAKWICLDADKDTQWQGLVEMARDLDQQGVRAYLEPSRRGGHLWVFTPQLSGTDARRFGKYLLAQYKLDSIELYPKQDRLTTGPGSFVRLPLGRHRKSGRRYHFITPGGEPLAPTIREQIALLASPTLVSQVFVDQALIAIPATSPVSPTLAFMPMAEEITGSTLSERLKNRVSVYEFVSRYVKLDQNGTGHCPFHEDQHKSFGVNQEGNYWHCWAGCGGGSIVDFWMKWREKQGQDSSFTATVTELASLLL